MQQNRLLRTQQEERKQKLEEVTRKLEESRKEFDKLRDLVLQQTDMIDKCLSRQMKYDRHMEKLMDEREEDRALMRKTQEQVQLICKWIQAAESRKFDSQQTQSSIGSSVHQITPGKSGRTRGCL